MRKEYDFTDSVKNPYAKLARFMKSGSFSKNIPHRSLIFPSDKVIGIN